MAGVPCQIIPHPPAQSASAPGSRKIFYDSLFSTCTLRLAALIEWETEIRQAGEAGFFLNLENDENNALRFSHDFAGDFETLKPDLYYEKIAAACDTRHVAATCDGDGRFILFCRKSSATSGKHT